MSTFVSKVNKNAPAIEACLSLGSSIVVQKDSHAKEVTSKCERLQTQWTKLLKNIAERGKELAEAKDIVKYFDDVQQAMAWIKEKEILISSQVGAEPFNLAISIYLSLYLCHSINLSVLQMIRLPLRLSLSFIHVPPSGTW